MRQLRGTVLAALMVALASTDLSAGSSGCFRWFAAGGAAPGVPRSRVREGPGTASGGSCAAISRDPHQRPGWMPRGIAAWPVALIWRRMAWWIGTMPQTSSVNISGAGPAHALGPVSAMSRASRRRQRPAAGHPPHKAACGRRHRRPSHHPRGQQPLPLLSSDGQSSSRAVFCTGVTAWRR